MPKKKIKHLGLVCFHYLPNIAKKLNLNVFAITNIVEYIIRSQGKTHSLTPQVSCLLQVKRIWYSLCYANLVSICHDSCNFIPVSTRNSIECVNVFFVDASSAKRKTFPLLTRNVHNCNKLIDCWLLHARQKKWNNVNVSSNKRIIWVTSKFNDIWNWIQ